MNFKSNHYFGNLEKSTKGFLKNSFFSLSSFFSKLYKSYRIMSVPERYISICLAVILILLLGVKANRIYTEKTRPVPGYGGTYKEAVVGDMKYLNPILASSDTDKSISNLLYSSLISFDKDGNPLPGLAKGWNISADGLTYTFTLNSNVYFHDDEPLTSSDVVYTVETIKDSNNKSPLYDKWKDVAVSASDNKVVFTLPKSYGAFIYNCNIGIIPEHLSMDDLAKKNIGSGPFQFVSADKTNTTAGNRITKLKLKKNDKYFGGSPYLSNIELFFYQDENKAKLAYQNGEVDAISGIATSVDKAKDFSFQTAKRLALIFNLRSDKLKDEGLRKKIAQSENSDTKVELNLITLDGDLQKQKAEEIKNNLASKNIKINIKYCNPVELKNALDKKDYELLLYGFDFSYDRDPYAFWHSTQLNKSNFAGYSNKDSDILLEDARMILDKSQRNAKYDQFYNILASQSLAVFYDPIKYNFLMNDSIKGSTVNQSNDVALKYFGIEKWYIKEGRERK